MERDRADATRSARACAGTVRNITNFGIFVGLEEGIDGLVHVSDISWTEQIKHPGEKFKKGDVVEAVVLKIDKENEKFSLGIKQLAAEPVGRDPEALPGRQRGDGHASRASPTSAPS